MRLNTRLSRLIKAACLMALATGCERDVTEGRYVPPDDGREAPVGDPEVLALSASEVVIGETVEFFGHNFLHDETGDTRLHFVGAFQDVDASLAPIAVDLYLTPTYGGEEVEDQARQILSWSRFGPFKNPFTGDARRGTFTGEVSAITTATADGLVSTSAALPITLIVGTSLAIERFAPMGAECAAPALRALAGLAYELTVRPLGIKATRFVYELSNVNGQPGATVIEHDFGRGNAVSTDTLGLQEAVLFNPINPQEQSYVTVVKVRAYDDEGGVAETVLPISVHRPLEVLYQGKQELAEHYDPMPVSGCTPGGINTTVSYSERVTEQRQQSVSVTINRNWSSQTGRTISNRTLEGITTGESSSSSLGGADSESARTEERYGVTYGRNESNNVNVSSTDGESYDWNTSEGLSNEEYGSRMNMLFGEGSWSGTVGAEGSGSVPGFAKVTGKVSTTVGVKAGASTTGTEGSSVRVSTNRGYSAGSDVSETRSFGSTVAESESRSLGGAYSLTTDRSRSFKDEATRNESRTWNLSSGAADSETATVGNTEAENQTWTSSEALTTEKGITGFIPNGQVGLFYRQTTRWVRRAEVRQYDLCGVATHAGELQFNEWTWAASLALGDDCASEPPASELPEAKCFIPPCGG